MYCENLFNMYTNVCVLARGQNCACTEHLLHMRREPKGHSRSVFGTEKVHLHIAKMRIGHATDIMFTYLFADFSIFKKR